MEKKDKCCTPKGQVPRYVDCKGCDKKPIEKMSKQTAVEWLESQINLGLSERGLISAFKEAKQMEKEQVMKSYYDGEADGRHNEYKGREQYYNETYGGKP